MRPRPVLFRAVLRHSRFFLLTFGVLLAGVPSVAQEVAPGPVVVADVRGPLEQRGLDFLADVVANEDAQLVVLKIDNPGVASGDPRSLFAAIADARIPVVAWVGPGGARAYGGVAQLLDVVAIVGAAPGVRIGFALPTVAEGPILEPAMGPASLDPTTVTGRLASSTVLIGEADPPAFVDIVQPTIGQFIAALDGRTVATASGPVVLETAKRTTLEDGSTTVISSVEVRFLKPTLFTRFLRLGDRPDAAFFFLLAGLAVAAFEFYAAGVGVAAAVAVLLLFLAGFGMATLPVSGLAVALAIAGVGLYTWDLQRNELGARSILGTIIMIWGGLTFVGGGDQFGTDWWAVLLIVLGIMLFYLFALTTIVRLRFGTPTIGREHLIGMKGLAESALDPEGVVVIDGARWRGRAHRAAGVAAGMPVEVLAVEGITLRVAPLDESASGS